MIGNPKLSSDLRPLVLASPHRLAGRGRAHGVAAGVDGHVDVSHLAHDLGVVALHLEAGRGRRGDGHRQPEELGVEQRRAAPRHRLAIALARGVGRRRRLAERRPRARDAAQALVAVGQVEQRADARVEPLARLEARAGLGELLLQEELLPLVEERLRGRFVARGLRGGRKGGEGEGRGEGERGGRERVEVFAGSSHRSHRAGRAYARRLTSDRRRIDYRAGCPSRSGRPRASGAR